MPEFPENTHPFIGFDVKSDENGTEIVKDGRKFEILCAKPEHPYCSLAEDRFVEAFAPENQSNLSQREDQEVTIYLRDKDNFQTTTVTFKATLLIKKNGVHSAVVVEPAEIAGLLCAPTGPNYNQWVVFRPFDPDYLDPAIAEANPNLNLLPRSPLSSAIPRIKFPMLEDATQDRNDAHQIEISELATQGIISKNEVAKCLARVRGVYLAEDSQFKIEAPIDGTLFKLEIDDATETPSLEREYLILTISTNQWPEMKDVYVRFLHTTPSSHGYHQFTKGKIVIIEGEHYFKAECKPSQLTTNSTYIFEQRGNNTTAIQINVHESLARLAENSP